jgi:hypothetical protein
VDDPASVRTTTLLVRAQTLVRPESTLLVGGGGDGHRTLALLKTGLTHTTHLSLPPTPERGTAFVLFLTLKRSRQIGCRVARTEW